MREAKITDDKIIKELTDKSFCEFTPICLSCICDVLETVTEVFTDIHCDIFQIEDNLYTLRVSV